jgi:hypothetical protein
MNVGSLSHSVFLPVRLSTAIALSSVVFGSFAPGEALAQQFTHISVGQGGAQPNGASEHPTLSDDTRFVAFSSAASNLVANDNNGSYDVFVRDRQSSTTTRISLTTAGEERTGASMGAEISGNGRFVVFLSNAPLTADDTQTCGVVPSNCYDVFLHDRDTATTTKISVGVGGAQANGASDTASISADGRYIVFASAASNLVPDDTNGLIDTFLYDRVAATMTRISLTVGGAQLTHGSRTARISDDGEVIVYSATVAAQDHPNPAACVGQATCDETIALQRATGARSQLSGLFPPIFASDFTPGTMPRIGDAIGDMTSNGRMVLVEQHATATADGVGSVVALRSVILDRATGRVQTMGRWGGGRTLRRFTGISDDGRAVGSYTRTGLTSVSSVIDLATGTFSQVGLPSFEAPSVIDLGVDGRAVTVLSRQSLDGSPETNEQRLWLLDRDMDDDLLIDQWETDFGLDPAAPGDATLDSDSDGLTNLQEHAQGSHPKGTFKRYFAEGAANAFFNTRFATLNVNASRAAVVYRFLGTSGQVRSHFAGIDANSRASFTLSQFSLSAPENDFSTVIESDQPVVVDRTMAWDATGIGSHAETSIASPSTTWFMAEGATHGAFDLFYLLQNPGDTAATATINYLRLAPNTPVVKSYTLPPHSRKTIWVDDEGPELAATDVAASITSDQPIIVERAMYASAPGQPFRAGHGGAAVSAPALRWFLAEGATGTFFDMYVLIGNPGTTAANLTLTYLLPSGETVTKTHDVGPQNRLTLTVADEDPRLADTPVSVIVESTNSQPVVVERAMWWPKGQWYEAHLAAGATQTATRWALADGELTLDASNPTETYILIANTGATAGTATVTLYRESLPTPIVATIELKANSRVNVPVSDLAGPNINGRFGAVVESDGVPIVVERAMYTTANGVLWTAGTASLATPLP